GPGRAERARGAGSYGRGPAPGGGARAAPCPGGGCRRRRRPADSPGTRGSRTPRQPGLGGVLVAHEPLDRRGLVRAEPVGPRVEPVLALERRRERGRDVVELGPMAECLLERRQGRERIVGRRKDRGHALGVDAEQDRPVLDERPAGPPLPAPDELAPAELDLAAAGA